MHSSDSPSAGQLTGPQAPSAVTLYDQPASSVVDGSTGDPGMLLQRSIAALLRYKWLIVAIVVLSGIAGFFIKNRFSSVYQAEGKLWISTGTGTQAQLGPVRGDALLPSNSNSWGDLVASNIVIDKTVQELHLYVRPLNPQDAGLFASVAVAASVRPGIYDLRVDSTGRHYALSAAAGRTDTTIERGTVGDSIGRGIGLRWAPPASGLQATRHVLFSLTTPRDAAQQLKGQITSIRPYEGNVLRVMVSGGDPWRAARIVNSLERQVVATAGEFKRRNLTEVRQTLGTQLSYAATALNAADDSLEQFRARTITLPSEGRMSGATGAGASGSPLVTNYFSVKLEYESVTRERAALEQTLADIQSGKLDVPALWLVLPAEGSTQDIAPLLQEYTTKQSELRSQLLAYTDNYQGVKATRAALAQLRDRDIPNVVHMVIEQLRRRESSLQSQLSMESASLKAIPSRTIDEARLVRNVEARTQLYSMLQSRYEEASLAEMSVEPDLSILDSASTPQWPVSSRGRQVFLLVILGGFGAAVTLALLLDRLDKRMRYTQQVPARLGLHVLGAVPHIARRREPDPLKVAQLVESFRSLRLNVAYAVAEQGPLMLSITSAASGDGKSLVSANLALAFAESGYRTLLIDGDVRRGTLHTTFGTERRRGLVDVLRGSATFADTLRPTTHPNLSLLPSGSRLKIAPELLASEAFPAFIRQVRSGYDAVLIDTPPLAAGMDPHAVCVATGHVLFVVRLAQTDSAVARQKLELLQRFPVRIIGSVVNDVSSSIGLNTEYSYLSAYAIRDEDELLPSTA